MTDILNFFQQYFESFYPSNPYNNAARILTIGLFISLLLTNVFSFMAIKRYLFKRNFSQSKKLALMNHAPGISIITGAYNESLTIINNVHSLLSLNYHKFELIIVNDGSKDDTLEKLIREFNLEETNYIF